MIARTSKLLGANTSYYDNCHEQRILTTIASNTLVKLRKWSE
jgi:hypothetical protein